MYKPLPPPKQQPCPEHYKKNGRQAGAKIAIRLSLPMVRAWPMHLRSESSPWELRRAQAYAERRARSARLKSEITRRLRSQLNDFLLDLRSVKNAQAQTSGIF